MPSVLDNDVAATPNGEMSNGTHKVATLPPEVDEDEDCVEPDGEGAADTADEYSDSPSDEPVTVVETEEYKESTAESSGEGLTNGSASTFIHTYVEDDEEESDFDEDDIQPVQASLVLQFTAAANGAANVTVNGSVTPTPSRKNSGNSRNSWAGNSNYGGSAYSTMERNPRRSRLSAQGHFGRPHALSTSASDNAIARRSAAEFGAPTMTSPPPNFYGSASQIAVPRLNGVNSVDFMAAVSEQSRALESSLRELRSELTDPVRVNELGQEAIVLSGLKDKASQSLQDISRLYEETKYLKSYLEKVEEKVHHDFATTRKNPKRSSWFRRIAFATAAVSVSAATAIYAYSALRPEDFSEKKVEAAAALTAALARSWKTIDWITGLTLRRSTETITLSMASQ